MASLAYKAGMTGEQIVAVRKSRGMNQAAFWAPLGLTQAGGSRYETGRNIPKPSQKLLLMAYGTRNAAVKALAALRGEG